MRLFPQAFNRRPARFDRNASRRQTVAEFHAANARRWKIIKREIRVKRVRKMRAAGGELLYFLSPGAVTMSSAR
jgi:hypothetical protein